MGKKSPLVDTYIEEAAPFAKPILKKLRTLFHKASPKLEESIKWGHVSFEYKGIVGGFAAFKQHVSWGMWKASLLDDPKGAMNNEGGSSMAGGKFADVGDLPDDDYIVGLIRQAIELNEKGVKVPSRSNPKPKAAIPMPKPFAAALSKAPKAKTFFEELAPSCKREYLEWITEAKRDETRDKRITQAIEWLSEGKKRNWKYEKC